MAELIYLIDSGHGGLINNVYQTAPNKMYRHSEDNSIAYEGVTNREIKYRVFKQFDLRGIKYIDICPTQLDVDLDARCNIINTYCREYGKNNCLLISLHMNAGKGEGFEIWTSPGASKSDKYADQFMYFYEQYFPYHKLRKDMADGDVDKESPFYILVNSICPAILPEWLFFDNFHDWQIQRDPLMQDKYAKMIAGFCQEMMFKPY